MLSMLSEKGRRALLAGAVMLALGALSCRPAAAQSRSDVTKYEYGKQLLQEGKYPQAAIVLGQVAEAGPNSTLYFNASYLQALAAYRGGQLQEAREKLFKLTRLHADWPGIGEAYFLLAAIDFEQEQPEAGMKRLQALGADWEEPVYRLKKQAFGRYTAARLKTLHAAYPQDEALGRVLLGKLYEEEGSRATEGALMQALEARYNAQAGTGTAAGTARKDTYHIGIMLPFKHQQITSLPKANFALDLYEGMLLAAQHLGQEGIRVKCYAFDTQRDSAATAKILTDPELAKLDLIIGPVYGEAIDQVHSLSERYGIPVVNPVLDDIALVQDRPLSFMIYPHAGTQASFAADYAFKKLKSLTAYVVYGNKPKDLAMARAYRARLEALGGTVADTIALNYGEHSYKRLMKRLEKLAGRPNAHVFVASSESTDANTLISALQAVQSSATVLAPQRWLEIEQLNFGRLEAANVHFYCPMWMDESREEIAQFEQDYLRKANIIPSKYSSLGYESLYFFGRMLRQYGTAFPASIHQDRALRGKLYHLLSFAKGQDNGGMAMGRFQGGLFEIVYTQEP
jgi:ABC-type branched-subunit amino acid transport system substrate-binding protein